MTPDGDEFRCRVCSDHLVLEVEGDIDEDSSATQKVPDDLALRCGCHYHWQCFVDQAADVTISLQCPFCQASLPVEELTASSGSSSRHGETSVVIPVRYVNEGGIEDSLDIFPAITEEAYLMAHPEARPARAYHVMCAEGDVAGIVEMLHHLSAENGGDIPQLGHVLRYRDPLAGGVSGLHLAIQQGQEEVMWLLLWLASSVPTDVFPTEAQHMAQVHQIDRLDTMGADIRGLVNDAGRSALDIAQSQGGRWERVINTGVLASQS